MMVLTIQNNPGLSTQELSSRLGVSQRQCYRDLAILQEAGVPLYHDQGYRLVHRLVLKSVSFTLDEVLSLLCGLQLAMRQRGLFEAAAGVREKLLALLPDRLRREAEGLAQGVEVKVEPKADYSGKQEIFRLLNQAIKENQRLSMVYYTFSRDDVNTRLADPYHLVFHDGFWYLAAYCHHREEIRLFRVDRIQSLTPTGEHFPAIKEFDFDAYMGAAWRMERGREFPFEIRLTGDAARLVQETRFHRSQKVTPIPGNKEAVLFSARASGLRSIARWVLSFGGEAEVLAPEELRQYVIHELKKAMGGYS